MECKRLIEYVCRLDEILQMSIYDDTMQKIVEWHVSGSVRSEAVVLLDGGLRDWNMN